MKNTGTGIRSGNEFAENPTIKIPRSRFQSKTEHKTTMNVGDLVPTFWKEILPGDTIEMQVSEALRTSTMIAPVMDNMFRDTYAFFVPTRLLWTHWKEFNGENRTDKWTQKTKYTIPQLKAPTGGWQLNTIADYLRIPTKVENISVSALPTRAYALIVNEWFRDQNNQNPAALSLDDTTTTGSNGTDYITDIQKGGMCFKVNKYHDYFTSALPEPQKGDPVTIGLAGLANVITGNARPEGIADGMTLANSDGTIMAGTTSLSIDNGDFGYSSTTTIPTQINQVYPSNLYADLKTTNGITINALRQSIQLQELNEKDARGGTRYIEMIMEHFGVRSDDGRQQRPEFLGGNHQLMSVTQVAQTSGTTTDSPQGNLAAFSLTNANNNLIQKSFTEHGYIMILTAVRTNHTYQQGINRSLARLTREDYYLPVLANLGEQAILNQEIYADGTAADKEAFGYQMRYGEYHTDPSGVSGQFRSNATGTLEFWTYADKYASLPVLGPEWIAETKDNVDRTLAVKSTISNQIIADFFYLITATRPMPYNPIPRIAAKGL